MRISSNPTVLHGIFATAVVMAACACAQTGLPPKQLLDARDEFWRAKTGAAQQLDPTDLHEAEVALAQAESAWQKAPGDPTTIDLAIVAQRKAQTAEAEALAMQAERQAEEARRQAETVVGAQLQGARGALGQTERQLMDTQQELQQQHQQAAAQQQAVQELDKKVRDARETIAKIAQVKDDERGMVITLQAEVLFQTGKSDLKAGAMAKLDQIAEAMKGKEQPILVLGFTDSVGARDMNMELSRRRASAVRDYLVSKGIPQDLIRAEGRGADGFVADNNSVEGRTSNRRVEIVVQPKR
jgi:outer membrane protein OmpA-like peptidoglycan-associated protein